MSGINLSTQDGLVQEAGAEDGKQQTIGFLISMESDLGKARNEFCNGFFFNRGSFLTFPFGFFTFCFTGGLMWEEKLGVARFQSLSMKS